MAITDEVSRLQQAKASIKAAIEQKGVQVPNNITLSYYNEYILQIETQGTYQSKTVTPDATGQTVVADEGYDALSSVVVNGDINLISSNIKDGVTIFGVTGSLTPRWQLSKQKRNADCKWNNRNTGRWL